MFFFLGDAAHLTKFVKPCLFRMKWNWSTYKIIIQECSPVPHHFSEIWPHHIGQIIGTLADASLDFTRDQSPGCGISSIIDSVFADGGDDAIDHCTWEFNTTHLWGGDWTTGGYHQYLQVVGVVTLKKTPRIDSTQPRWWPIGSAPCVDSFLSTWRCSGLWTLSFGGAVCGFVDRAFCFVARSVVGPKPHGSFGWNDMLFFVCLQISKVTSKV